MTDDRFAYNITIARSIDGKVMYLIGTGIAEIAAIDEEWVDNQWPCVIIVADSETDSAVFVDLVSAGNSDVLALVVALIYMRRRLLKLLAGKVDFQTALWVDREALVS